MSDGKLPLYLDHEEAEIIFDCLKQREDLLNKAVHCCKDDAKSYIEFRHPLWECQERTVDAILAGLPEE